MMSAQADRRLKGIRVASMFFYEFLCMAQSKKAHFGSTARATAKLMLEEHAAD